MAVFTGNGSAASPSITFSSDTNTGIFRPTADTLAITTNGTNRVRIDNLGRILAGTEIAYLVSEGGSGGGPRQPGVFIASTSTNLGASLNIARWGTGVGAAELEFTKSRSGTVGVYGGSLTSTDTCGIIKFSGDSGVSVGRVAEIRGECDGSQTSGSSPGRLVIATTPNGVDIPTERARIDSTGRLYIGTTESISPSTSSGTGLGLNITEAGGILSKTSSSIGSVFLEQNVIGYTSGTTVYQRFRIDGTVIGSINTLNGTSTNYSTSSDYRLKENIVPLTGAIDRLQQIPVHRFNFITNPGTVVDGFIAHEVQEIVPECATGTKDETELISAVVAKDGTLLAEGLTESEWESGKIKDEEGTSRFPADSQWIAEYEVPVYQGIDQSKIVPLLTAALQEAIAEISDLKDRVAFLEGV